MRGAMDLPTHIMPCTLMNITGAHSPAHSSLFGIIAARTGPNARGPLPQKWGHAPVPPRHCAKLAMATLGNYVLRCRSLPLT